MKIVLILMVCGLAAAAPNAVNPEPVQLGVAPSQDQGPKRDLWDQLLPLIFDILRLMMREGYPEMGIPIMDPLDIDKFNISIPAGLVNLNLDLEGVHATGLSDFVVNSAQMNIIDLTFAIDFSLPTIFISAEKYDFVGDLFTAIPLYGKGKAVFKVDDFRFRIKIYFGQSENEQSIILERLDNVGYAIPFFKSDLTGAIGGGDIDGVVNAIINDVLIGYLNRFERFISHVFMSEVPPVLNPILERYNSWDFIDNFDRP